MDENIALDRLNGAKNAFEKTWESGPFTQLYWLAQILETANMTILAFVQSGAKNLKQAGCRTSETWRDDNHASLRQHGGTCTAFTAHVLQRLHSAYTYYRVAGSASGHTAAISVEQDARVVIDSSNLTAHAEKNGLATVGADKLDMHTLVQVTDKTRICSSRPRYGDTVFECLEKTLKEKRKIT